MDIKIHTRFDVGDRVFYTDHETGETFIGDIYKVSVQTTETGSKLIYSIVLLGLGRRVWVQEDLTMKRIIPDSLCAGCKHLYVSSCGRMVRCSHILCGQIFRDEIKGVKNPYKTKCLFHSTKQQ